jgi:hypothetical protein
MFVKPRYALAMVRDDLKSHEVEQLRRSVAMLKPAAPNGLSREEALLVLDQLRRALVELEHGPPAEQRRGP